MKYLFFALLFLLFPFLTNAQSKNIVIGTIDTVYSKVLNEKRAVWIYQPNHDASSIKNKKRYPVIYLLDGDWHFYSVVGMLQQLSFINGNVICPEMIVVGITTTDRFKDFTPTCDSTISPTSGGNKKFISFIEKELIPYIDSSYPTEPYRLLIGHSLGGLTVINTMEHNTDLFKAYVAIDPSMWWNKQNALKETTKILSEKKFENVRLFLGIANSMDPGMDTIKVQKDTTRNTLHIRSILELAKQLKLNTQNKLNYKYKYYKDENHGSVPLIATYDALHFIFDFYNLPLTKKDYSDTSMNLAYKIEKHYKNISEKMGYKISPSESIINTLGYNALMMKNRALAEYFFRMNLANFPKSSNAYDSFGDYYLELGDETNAIVMHKKALSLTENAETRKKLDKILKNK